MIELPQKIVTHIKSVKNDHFATFTSKSLIILDIKPPTAHPKQVLAVCPVEEANFWLNFSKKTRGCPRSSWSRKESTSRKPSSAIIWSICRTLHLAFPSFCWSVFQELRRWFRRWGFIGSTEMQPQFRNWGKSILFPSPSFIRSLCICYKLERISNNSTKNSSECDQNSLPRVEYSSKMPKRRLLNKKNLKMFKFDQKWPFLTRK